MSGKWSLAVVAILTAGLAAQQPAIAPVFRSATRLIQINVVVHDRQGQPTTGLQKEDFTLLEGGKPQQIALFSMNSASGTPRHCR